jgi:hypothetical protein
VQKGHRATNDAGPPPRDLPVSTAHPELRYELADEVGADPAAGPVYRRVPSGEVVVPTGRVLVSFAEDDSAAKHEEDLQAAGYVVDQVLSYAPHAAWVRAATGDVTTALRSLDALAKVAGVVAVEPQMIGSSSKRS